MNTEDVPRWWEEDTMDEELHKIDLRDKATERWKTACQDAYALIHEQGITGWLSSPDVKDKTVEWQLLTLENIKKYFLLPEVEGYEEAAFLQKQIDWISEEPERAT